MRLWLPPSAMVVLFLFLIFQIILPTFESELMAGKETSIRYLGETAWSILSHYSHLEQSGALTREKAQQEACERLRAIRYGADMYNYFWLVSYEGRVIMHPYRGELEGKRSEDIEDAVVATYVRMVYERIAGQPEGFFDYPWQSPDDSQRQIPKRAYVLSFAPWHWYVGTSLSLEDVAIETAALRNRLLSYLGSILVVVAALSCLTIRQNTRAERERTAAERALRDNEGRLRTILDTLQAGVIVVDAATHEILDANPTALRMIGAERAAVVGRICHKYICPASQGRCPISDLGQSVEQASKILLRADGGQVEIMKTVIPTELNGRQVLLESFVDISAHVATERELKQNVEQLSEAKARLEVLVANITGREKRMVELKREVNGLLQEMGRAPKYEAPAKVERLLKAQALVGRR